MVTFVDRSRRVRLPGPSLRASHPGDDDPLPGRRPPRRAPTCATRRPHAPPARFPWSCSGTASRSPRRLLAAAAGVGAAGYVVAAPIFPLENANAPGGPNESDLVHQPRDMRFVISRMLAAERRPPKPAGGDDRAPEIAVSGQSDGGETALAMAYDRRLPRPPGPRRGDSLRRPAPGHRPAVPGARARPCSPPRGPPTRSTCRPTPTPSSTPRRAPSTC